MQPGPKAADAHRSRRRRRTAQLCAASSPASSYNPLSQRCRILKLDVATAQLARLDRSVAALRRRRTRRGPCCLIRARCRGCPKLLFVEAMQQYSSTFDNEACRLVQGVAGSARRPRTGAHPSEYRGAVDDRTCWPRKSRSRAAHSWTVSNRRRHAADPLSDGLAAADSEAEFARNATSIAQLAHSVGYELGRGLQPRLQARVRRVAVAVANAAGVVVPG